MSASIADLSNLSPPSDDGAIQRALSDLETKLGAWTDAMLTAQCEIEERFGAGSDSEPREATDAAAPQESSDSPLEAADIAPTDIANPECVESPEAPSENDALLERLSDAMRNADHLARELGPEEATENPEGTEPSQASETTDEDIEEILATIDSEVAEQLRVRHAATGGRRSMREVCDEYFREVSDSEALLATLEPDVAKAIRVQFRLFNGRKSIRQLVDEYEPPKESSKKRKSWWRG
ncbi:MAG TPA: hypothetical protein P5081_04110 [Phycisphaerae bacterium]|nr:hypothetical protein [Phycisphaerae bacterium]HRW52045.1 hypothetical protein [Phycisphaerae bacterium]